MRKSGHKLLCLILVAAAVGIDPSSVSAQPRRGPGEVQVIVEVQSAPGRADTLRRLLAQLVEPTRRESGCLRYELFESSAIPGRFFLQESWVDRKALAGHLRSQHFLAISSEIERLGLIPNGPDIIVNPNWEPFEEFREDVVAGSRPIIASSVGASKPVLFAAGTISTGSYELNSAFTRDGKTLYFARSMPVFPFPNTFTTILVSQRGAQGWSEPRVASFSGIYADIDPYFSVDESKLFFMSNRPTEGSEPKEDFDLWVVDRDGSGWGRPQNLGAPINTEWWEGYPAVAASGNLYFFSTRPTGHGLVDIYRAEWLGDHFAEPVNLGPSINTAFAETNVYIAPDESFIIFSSSRLSAGSDPFERMDLYVSFRIEDGWTEAENLGDQINTPGWEFSPMVTPDGKYLFFTRATPRRDLRHQTRRAVTYRELERLLHGPQNGLGDIFFVEMSALRREWNPAKVPVGRSDRVPR